MGPGRTSWGRGPSCRVQDTNPPSGSSSSTLHAPSPVPPCTTLDLPTLGPHADPGPVTGAAPPCFLLNDCMTSSPAYGHTLGTVTSPMAPNKPCHPLGRPGLRHCPAPGRVQSSFAQAKPPLSCQARDGNAGSRWGLWKPCVLPIQILLAYFCAAVVFTKKRETCCPNPLGKASLLRSFLSLPGSLHSDSDGRARRGTEAKPSTRCGPSARSAPEAEASQTSFSF